MSVKLSCNERQFVAEFVKDLNPVLACERIGYDEILAPEAAYEMLSKEHVKTAMAESLVLHRRGIDTSAYSPGDLGITDGYVMMRLKSIADRANKPADQLKALELLGKSIGLFKENSKMEITRSERSAFSANDRQRMMETLAKRKKHGTAN